MLSPPGNIQKAGTTARVKARQTPILVWSPGVRVESRRPKVAPWRPLASKSPFAKSFVSGGSVRKRLIFLKWHGRGREFESHQVHQNISNTYRFLPSQTRSHRSPTGVQTQTVNGQSWAPMWI